MDNVEISIIVPCYNEEDALPIFYAELLVTLEKMAGLSYEIIFINDGSDDNSELIMLHFAEKNSRVKFISFSRNFGKEAAMLAGFRNSKGNAVTVMDADLQDPPSLLPNMYEIIKRQNYDSVATRRASRRGEPRFRSFFSKRFYHIMSKISNSEIEDGARDYRMMKRKMVDAIVEMSEYNRFSKGIFGWIGFKTYWLSYENVERVAGETKWNFNKLFKYAVEGIFNFSDIPLKISSWSGLIMTLFSILVMIYIIIRKLVWGNPTPGWASTATIIFFVSGIQLFCIGIMGQYIARIYMETKHRPHYIVDKSNIDNLK